MTCRIHSGTTIYQFDAGIEIFLICTYKANISIKITFIFIYKDGINNN